MIETKNLIIKPISTDDLDILFALFSNRKIMKYMPTDYMDLEDAKLHLEQIIQAWQQNPVTDFTMLVQLKETGKKIGRCRIHKEANTESAMIGWLLLEEEWGKGYATEITQALLDYCFDVLDIRRVFALCNPNNTGSWRVLEKSGMRREAHYIEKCKYIKDGIVSWHDELEYAILKSERKSS